MRRKERRNQLSASERADIFEYGRNYREEKREEKRKSLGEVTFEFDQLETEEIKRVLTAAFDNYVDLHPRGCHLVYCGLGSIE